MTEGLGSEEATAGEHRVGAALAGSIAQLGGIGRLRPAPGTWASAAAAIGLAIAWGRLPSSLWWLGCVLVTVIGWWATAVYVRERGHHDPSEVVVDELAGMLAAAAVASLGQSSVSSGTMALLLFAAFRAFDILKPWPIGWADRRLASAFGAMFDDLLAGLAAGAFVLGLLSLVG